MPKISVVVAAYNIQDWIIRCIESLKNQTFDDFEVIIVDDASSDKTAKLAASASKNDPRFSLIQHKQNQGPHIVRATGIQAVQAPWMLFLDGDDELAPTILEELSKMVDQNPCDLIHYGITVTGENGVTDASAEAFAAYINRPTNPQEGHMVLDSVCDERYGQLVDWRVTQCLMRTSLVKQAFSQMIQARLDRAEDAYEMFVISALAQSRVGFEECRGYLYHYGIGVTGASELDPKRFDRFCQQFKDNIDAIEAWVCEHPAYGREASYRGARRKLLQLLVNDMTSRVSPQNWDEAAASLARAFGSNAAAMELWRSARDYMYAHINSADALNDNELCSILFELAEKHSSAIDDATDSDAEHARLARKQAFDHKAEQDKMLCVERFADEDIRIFVTSHKRVDMPQSNVFQMVQVGPSLQCDRYRDALHDDEGENISAKNPMYCEMTTQYWAWKNINASYVGFCHYRRYFNFTDALYPENEFGEVMDGYINDETIMRYGLDTEHVRACVEGYDVLTTGFKTLADFPGEFATPREHYKSAPLLHAKDIETMASIVTQLYPDYELDTQLFLDGTRSCFCNMYIMKKPIFDAYCEWVFPVLDAFVEQTDMTHYSSEALRTPGHLAERLFNIYYQHAMRTGAGWKTKELQCVHFEHPDRTWDLEPLALIKAGAERANSVPVVFAADDAYVPMLATTIHSMLANANPERIYDIVILNSGISGEHQREMQEFFSQYEYANLRFEDVTRRIAGYELSTNNAHITNETYYRFLVQDLLDYYDKVLYLDSDIIITGDVAELYDTQLGDNLVAAVSDIDFVSQANVGAQERADYAQNVLGMSDPYSYFQAGVLVLNTRAMRELHTTHEWLELASRDDLIYNDQDVLNSECEGRVTFLDMSWNVVHNCNDRLNWLFNPYAPVALMDAYNEARLSAKIIHYAGFEKPWNHAKCDLAPVWWEYARETPFYEVLIDELLRSRISMSQDELDELARLARRTDFGRLVDKLAPEDTRRRQVMRKIARSIIK